MTLPAEATEHARTMANEVLAPARERAGAAPLRISLLTGGDDLSYALGLTRSLAARGVHLDFIGSDDVDAPELHRMPQVRFLNLRGCQDNSAPLARKMLRILRYYRRLMAYAVRAEPRLFHILWNNRFQHFDRTLLMLWYRALGRRVALTAHNVNAASRDGCDSALNRLTLRIQYRLCDHIFVHTARMRDELGRDFGVPADRISVIPFGINDTFASTALTAAEARQRLGLGAGDRVLLFFGQIAPYKGLEYLVQALPALMAADPGLRLVIAGKVKKGAEAYWRGLEPALRQPGVAGRVVQRIEFVPEHEVEVYFKAADVLVLPYVHIFQSGVPFLAYFYGVPVVAADVGSLRDDIAEGRTGWVCRSRDPADLQAAIERHFGSQLYRERASRRADIRAYAEAHHSWATVAEITEPVYRRLAAARQQPASTR